MKNILFFIALIFISCGARKVDKSKTQEVLQTETSDNSVVTKTADSNLKSREVTKVDDKNETVTKEVNYEPINPLLPASITDENGKKTVLDNAKKTTRETTQKNNTKTDISKKTEQVAKIVALNKKDVQAKTDSEKSAVAIKSERKVYSVFNFFWLLILVPIYLIWKNRSVIFDKIKSFWWV